MKEPKIRFKGYTDGWEQRKLGDEATEMIAGGDIDKDLIGEEGCYPVIANALTNDGIVGYYNSEFRIKAPAVTVTGRGDVGHAKARNIDFTPVVRLLSVKSNHDVFFLENAINRLHIVIESTGVPQLTVPQLAKYELAFPKTLEEEKQIGTFFRHLDHLITLHQRRCEETKILKKYMLQKMFPKNKTNIPEIRFDGFTDAWEQRKLGDYSELITKGTTPSSFCEDGNVTFVKIEALREKRVIKELCSAISEEIHKGELARSILKENDIVFAIAGATVGKCAIITSNILPANTNQALAIIRLKSSINRDFVYFSLTSKQMEIYINQSKSVGAQPNLSLAQMNAFEFLCPCKKEEQQKIGDYFSTLDNLITLHQRKCDELLNIKKFMLQNMFV